MNPAHPPRRTPQPPPGVSLPLQGPIYRHCPRARSTGIHERSRGRNNCATRRLHVHPKELPALAQSLVCQHPMHSRFYKSAVRHRRAPRHYIRCRNPGASCQLSSAVFRASTCHTDFHDSAHCRMRIRQDVDPARTSFEKFHDPKQRAERVTPPSSPFLGVYRADMRISRSRPHTADSHTNSIIPNQAVASAAIHGTAMTANSSTGVAS